MTCGEPYPYLPEDQKCIRPKGHTRLHMSPYWMWSAKGFSMWMRPSFIRDARATIRSRT